MVLFICTYFVEESFSGEAGNSPGRTSGELGIGLFMGRGTKRQVTPREVAGEEQWALFHHAIGLWVECCGGDVGNE